MKHALGGFIVAASLSGIVFGWKGLLVTVLLGFCVWFASMIDSGTPRKKNAPSQKADQDIILLAAISCDDD